MSMPRPPTAHRHPHSNARQFDLFCDPPYAGARPPHWQASPAATRHTLTKLLVRLIFGHADGDLAREREEMRGRRARHGHLPDSRRESPMLRLNPAIVMVRPKR